MSAVASRPSPRRRTKGQGIRLPKTLFMRISVIGLGKLGAPAAAVFAAKGHDVIGLDVNITFVNALRAGKPPVEEPRLQEMIDAGRTRLTTTSDYDELVNRSDVSFIIVPTPSDPSGRFSNEYVVAAVEALGKALRKKTAYHVVAVTSTVMPGATGGPIREALERASGRRVGSDVGLCYNPEFIALGSVVDNMLDPDFILIGESDPKAGSLVASIYESVCAKKPPVRRMNWVNAELAKISVNTFVTTKISYANMLADLCDRLPEADVDVVAEAVGSDSRIGRKYLRGAVGYGGPCFPRDNIAFAALASSLGAHADIAVGTDTINRYQIDRLMAAVTRRVSRGARVAVLGMAYKPHTPVIEESQGVMLAQRLSKEGFDVVIHDSLGASAALRILGSAVSQAQSPEEALRDADIGVIVTAWPEYVSLGELVLPRAIPVIDCWRILPRDAARSLQPVWLGYGELPTAASRT